MPIYDEVYRSPNFGYPKGSFGRAGQGISGICLHITGAHWESNYSWIMNPAANASYNAVIKDDGKVVSLVPEHTAAYSHGRVNRPSWPLLKQGVNPNLYSLSLARTGSNQNTWTPQQLASTLRVLRYWGAKYNIPLKRPYIFGHFEIDSVNRWYCPGRGFFDRVIEELKNSSPLQAEEIISSRLREDMSPSQSPPGVPEEQVIWHRVIAGSFRNRDNAERQLERLKALGIEGAFILRHQI